MRILILTCSVFFGGAFTAHAAKWEAIPKHTLGVLIGAQAPSLDLEVKDEDNPASQDITYKPNVGGRTLVGLGYGPFLLSAGFPQGVSSDSRHNKGKTKADDWQFRFFRQKWTWDFMYQSYRGYYIDNSSDIDPAYSNTDERILRPDIASTKYTLQTVYTFDDDDFHLSSPFGYGVRAKKSGGSWLGILNFSYNRIRMDEPLIPTQQTANYDRFGQFQGGELYSLKGGFGYGHIFTWSDFYAGAQVGLSYGLEQQRYTLADREHQRNTSRGGFNGHAKVAFGHNSEHFFATLAVFADSTGYKIEEAQLNTLTITTMILFGYRFDDVPLPLIDRMLSILP